MIDNNTAKNIDIIEQPNLILHNIQKQEIDIEEFLEQINFLYRNVSNKNECYIKMMNKYDYLNQANASTMVKLNTLFDKTKWYLYADRDNKYVWQKPDILDLYHSLNIYGNMKEEGNKKICQSTENIKSLIGMMIDIDMKESIFSNMDLVNVFDMLTEEKIIGGTIPNCNAVIYTGGGLHLIYKFKYPIPATDKSKSLVSKMQDAFTAHIKEQLVILDNKKVKLDKLSLVTSTRISSSYNSKTLTKVKFVIVNEKLLELNEYQKVFDEIKPYSRKNKSKKLIHLGLSNKGSKAIKTHMMLETRKNDLIRLQNEYPEVCVDNEEKMCFLYCNFTIQQLYVNHADSQMKAENKRFEDIEMSKEQIKVFFTDAYNETVEFNSNFEKPYKPRQFRSKMNSLTKRTYKFKTETIVAWLDIPEDVQWNLKTIAIPSVVKARNKVRNKETAQKRKEERRNENGLTSREQQKQDLINKVKELKEQGLKQKEVAEILEKGIATVKRYWNI